MKKLLLSFFTICSGFSFAQTTLIDPNGNGGFESGTSFAANGWTVANGTNAWIVNTAATVGFSGVRCAYISNSSPLHQYAVGTASVSHMYRDVAIPANMGSINLSFSWTSRGENNTDDNLSVYVVPTTTTPTAGTQLTAANLVGGPYSQTLTWGTASISLPCSYSGTTVRIVFSWRNDGAGGNQPPAAVDNVSLTCAAGCTSSLGTGVTNVSSLPYTAGAGTICGTVNDLTSANMVVCGSTAYLGGDDAVWIFTPTTSGSITISFTSTGSWTGMFLYDGCPLLTNPCGGSSGNCVANITGSAGSATLSGCVTAGTTYYLVVDSWPPPTCNAYSNLTISAPSSPTCAGSLGTGVVNIASLPYSSPGRTTCGKVDDLTMSNMVVCGSTSYTTGEDEVFVFTPTASGSITIAITSTGSYTGLMLYSGCPVSSVCSGSPGTCVAYEQSYTGSKSLCTNVTAGTTYYLVVDSWASPTCNPYDITISAPSGASAGATCATAPTITLPYSATGHTTACFGNDYSNASTGSCATLYESGEDRVYSFTTTGSACIGVTLSNASTSSIGFQIYSGCPGTAGTTCVGSAGGSNPLSATVTVPSAGTYYLIVDTWASPNNATYDISVQNFGSGPSNDLPCNATALTLGTAVTGNNSCSGGTGEPAAPSCWWAGTLNTVWYSVVAPASGNLNITTALGTLTNTQIQVYSGTCNSLTALATGCNDDATACGSWVYYSTVSLTGLTAGATYYIRVDGYGNATGSFTIEANENGSVNPTNQDCSGAVSVCSTVITQNTSFFGCGNTNDIPTSGSFGNPSTNPASTNSGCMFSDELHTVWYTIPISSNGNLAWTLTQGTSGFYDWNLYPLTTNTCADIANNLVAPVRCNWNSSSTSSTGMQNTVPAGGVAGNFEPVLPVTAGQTYVLCLSNYSGTTGGYTLNFTNSTAGIATPTQITWTGASSTAWATTQNWGGCNPPSCTMDALVVASTNQPVISANASVKNLTIAAGATLTINAGVTLTVCGNFTNNGTLIADPTSTILFNNAAVAQSINGSLTGTNGVGNLTITKTGGSVTLNNDINIKGTFTTSNATSIFNTTGKYVYVGGNFSNFAGNTTFTNTGTTGTLEFNGTGAQTYNQGNANLDLNYIVMNNTGTGVTLASNMRAKTTTGSLTLTAGKIITTGAYEVYVLNTTPGCVSTGNTSSFVQGYLRRAIGGTGTYEFPLGEASKGFERASINFTAATTTINNIRGEFQLYASTPAALAVTDCAIPYNLPALDCGKWRLDAYNSTGTQITGNGTYDVTLWPRTGSYTNGGTANEWTVMKDPNSTGTWGLYGTCNLASGINQVMRTGMTGFSSFGVAQSTTALPVELLEFTGESLGKTHLLKWTTATEINNDYFALERSVNGSDYFEINRQDGAINSNSIRNYSFEDKFPEKGLNYYRLRQVNTDGSISYSNVVVLNYEFGIVTISNLHPNPTNNDMFCDLTTTEDGRVDVELFDMYGKLVYNKSLEVNKGKTTIEILTSQLSRGVYSLRISQESAQFSSVHRVVKN